jgi:hypothetical protein
MAGQTLAEIIDEAFGIRGPEDLLKLVLIGVGIAVAVVAWFMTTVEIFSLVWWSLLGFEILAGLLCVSCLYVVMILLPSMTQPPSSDRPRTTASGDSLKVD